MKKKIFDLQKEIIINFLVLFFFSLLIYSQLMVNHLTNDYDGLWEWSFHNAGAWELSIGRWFWLYLSRLRFAVAPDPITSIISLFIYVTGLMMFFDCLDIKRRGTIFLAGAMFLCTPVICISLSYRYMSPTFAVSFLFSILAVWCVEKLSNPWLAIAGCAISVMLSMGAYQAYIGCTCVTIVAWFMKKLQEKKELKSIFLWVGKAAAGVVIGGILYIVALKLHQAVFHVKMSDYMGGDGYSIWNSVKNFGKVFIGSFQILYLFMKGILFKVNILQKYYIYYIVVACLLVFMVKALIKLFRESALKGILYLVAVIFLPSAAVAVKFIATDAGLSLQTMGGLFLLFPAVFCSLLSVNAGETKLYEKIAISLLCIVFGVYAYGGLYQVIVDQNIMLEGRTSSVAITELALDKINQLDYLDPENVYCFYGTPAGSPLFNMDKSVTDANMYAIFGAWAVDNQSAKSWRGLVNDVMGLKLNMATQGDYGYVRSLDILKEMPVFPAPGSVTKVDNIVIVKISQ